MTVHDKGRLFVARPTIVKLLRLFTDLPTRTSLLPSTHNLKRSAGLRPSRAEHMLPAGRTLFECSISSLWCSSLPRLVDQIALWRSPRVDSHRDGRVSMPSGRRMCCLSSVPCDERSRCYGIIHGRVAISTETLVRFRLRASDTWCEPLPWVLDAGDGL